MATRRTYAPGHRRRHTIREFVTINTGTIQDAGVTRIGDDNWIMAYVHIAHDCQLGSHIIMANAATLGGHALGRLVLVGGLTGIHQFVRRHYDGAFRPVCRRICLPS